MWRFNVFGYISFAVVFLSLNSSHADETVERSENVQQSSSFPVAVFCENRLTAFTVSDNTRFVSSSSLVYEDVTEEICLKMCSSNRDNRGRRILCASTVYDHATFVCTIFRSTSYPEGDLKTMVAPGQRLFEKFCLKDAQSECAESRFLKVDQAVIIGYAKNVSIVRSIEECMEQCFAEHFQCKSVMYFYTEGECITNTESAMTQPTSFAREESDKVIYIQNGCPAILARQRQLEKITTADHQHSEQSLEQPPSSAEEEHIKHLNVETETISSATTTAEGDSSKTKKEGEEIRNTASSIIANSSVENTSNKQNDLNHRAENKIKKSSAPDSRKLASIEQSPAASATEEMPGVLELNLKKLTTNSSTVSFSFNKRLKSLKQTKLQQMKEKLTSEGNEENHIRKNLPLEVRPSPLQVESQQIEKTSSPAKRLKITTLNEFKDEDHFSQWSNWSPCRRSGEKRIRRRKCYNLQKCVGSLMEVKKCPNTIQGDPEIRAIPDDHGIRTTVGMERLLLSVPRERLNLTSKADVKTGIQVGIASQLQKSYSDKESMEKANKNIWSAWRGVCQVNIIFSVNLDSLASHDTVESLTQCHEYTSSRKK
ncbi:unnamed protein product [Litomosoides sigmodontis]|uniref:Apple domain-containing protein n=1 Tax=Litomosoides sigmodontis TaxID=42156 RepID=A0A3P7K4H3_LITSI|nr:unnamed protein product [Litomosoides sigmodontis]